MTKFNEMYPDDPGGQMMAATSQLTPRLAEATTSEELDVVVKEMRETYDTAGPGPWRAALAGFMRYASRRGMAIAQEKLRKEEAADG